MNISRVLKPNLKIFTTGFISLAIVFMGLLASTQVYAINQFKENSFYTQHKAASIHPVTHKKNNKGKHPKSLHGHYLGLVSFTQSEGGEVLEGISINLHEDGTVTYVTEEEAGPSDMETAALGVWEQKGNKIFFGVTGYRSNEGFCSSISSNAPPIYPTCKLVVYFEGEVNNGVLTGTAKVGAASSVTDGPTLFEIEVQFELKKQRVQDYRDRFEP